MSSDLTVSSYVSVGADCPMRYQFNGRDAVEFAFGGQRAGFEFLFTVDALRAFVSLSVQALGELPGTSAA